jgi:hypothetical protein
MLRENALWLLGTRGRVEDPPTQLGGFAWMNQNNTGNVEKAHKCVNYIQGCKMRSVRCTEAFFPRRGDERTKQKNEKKSTPKSKK